MTELQGFQRKYLRGVAHSLKPLVQVGKTGLSDSVLASIDQGLTSHELIKVRFLDFKDQRQELTQQICQRLDAGLAGLIGHTAILYRPHSKPEKRRITLPEREG